MNSRSRSWREARPPGAVLGLLLALGLTLFALAPLTYPGFFQARSGFLPALNAANIEAAPNWGSPDGHRPAGGLQGEGRLPYLLAQPFLALSGSGVTAIKGGYALAFLLGATGVYGWTRRRLGNRAAALAATVYTYLPWHLSAVYARGAYAEAWLWALWPFLLWAVDGMSYPPKGNRSLAGVVACLALAIALLAAAFWTQPGLAALSLPLLVVYALVVHLAHRPAVPLVGVALLLLLALLATAAVASDGSAGSSPSQFLYPYQLLVDGRREGLSFQLGAVAFGLAVMGVALGATRRREQVPLPVGLGRQLWFWAAALLAVVALTLPLSRPLWRLTGFEALVAQPWQVLALAGPPLAFLAGATVRLDRRLAVLPALAGLLALVILASYPRLAPAFTRDDPGPAPVAAFDTAAPGPAAAGDTARVLLLDYRVAPPTEITPTLTLTLTWQAVAPTPNVVAPVEADYTVFVHLLAGEEKVAQRDSQPCDGECPTSTWQPGRIVVDRHILPLPPEAAPGPYRLAVGLYLLESGDRAAVLGQDDRTVYLDVR